MNIWPKRLPEHIPEGAQVYWEGSVKGAWYLLGRASYFGLEQGAGVVFSEDLAVEFQKRGKTVNALDGVDYVDIWRPGETIEQTRTRYRVNKNLARNDLVAACTAEPELDFLVLTRRVDGAYLTVWYARTSDQHVTMYRRRPLPNCCRRNHISYIVARIFAETCDRTHQVAVNPFRAFGSMVISLWVMFGLSWDG